MKKILPSFLFLFLLFFAIALGISGVCVYGVLGSGTEEQEASVMITGYQINPATPMRNDVGTVTVTVKNMESDKSVNIKDARMLSRDIKVLSDSYFNIGDWDLEKA